MDIPIGAIIVFPPNFFQGGQVVALVNYKGPTGMLFLINQFPSSGNPPSLFGILPEMIPSDAIIIYNKTETIGQQVCVRIVVEKKEIPANQEEGPYWIYIP